MMFYLPLFLIGLAFGSFFNVLAFRFKEGQFVLGRKVIGGRSHCLHCGKVLHWYELVPVVSFFLQLGRCRFCRRRLSLQYPFVELITGFIFFIIPYYFLDYSRVGFFSWPSSFLSDISIVLWTLTFAVLFLMALIDFREYLVPDEIIYFLFIAAVMWNAIIFASGSFGPMKGSFLGPYADLFGFRSDLWINHLLGAFAGLAAIGLIFFLSRGRAIGFGDVKLLAALGLLFGWPDVALILILSFVIGAAVSLVLVAKNSKKMKDFVPFAPFIALSAFLVFFFGAKIMEGYFIIFNPFTFL